MQLGDRSNRGNFVAVLLVVLVSVAGLAFGCDEPEQADDQGQPAAQDQELEEPVMDDEGRPHFEEVADEAAEEADRAAAQDEAEGDDDADDEAPADEDEPAEEDDQ